MSTIFITGITRGIGRACAERFRQSGWRVMGCARPSDRLKALADDWPDAKLFPADLERAEDLRNLCRALETLEIDALVNNAGVFIPGALSEEADGVFERTLQVNLAAPYHLTRAVLPRMKAQRAGTIVNVSSTAGVVGYPNGGSYCVSKHGLMGLTRALREELKPVGVRVVAVLPGATLTDSWSGTDLPPERFMTPEAVAEVVYCACALPAGVVMEDVALRPQLGDIG